jgi:hypothetical protein
MNVYFTVSQKNVLENVLTIFQVCSAYWFFCSSSGMSFAWCNTCPSSPSFLMITLIELSFFLLSFLDVLIGSIS